MKLHRYPALSLLLPLLLSGAATLTLADEITIDNIPTATLLAYLAEGEEFLLLDARSSEEYEGGHIHGALSVPHDGELETSALAAADSDTAIVVYCKSGQRAWLLRQRLLAAGYGDVRILSPAQISWADDLPVFNCGVELPAPFTLVLAATDSSQSGERP